MQDEGVTRQIRVWDLPVRVFHWGLVGLVGLAWISVEAGWMEVHEWCGYSILTLLAFRILWGLVGSSNARFSRFVRAPGVALAYLKALLRREAAHHDTHNPAGGWGVILMLALLLLQAGTGLFASDDVLFEGPFFPLVGERVSGWLTEFHEFNFDLLLILVGLHLAAVAWHELSGERVVRAMLHGRKTSTLAEATQRPLWLAVVVAVLAVGAIWGLLSLAPAPAVGF